MSLSIPVQHFPAFPETALVHKAIFNLQSRLSTTPNLPDSPEEWKSIQAGLEVQVKSVKDGQEPQEHVALP